MDEDELLQEAPRPQHSRTRPIIISVLVVFVIAIVVGSVIFGAQLASKKDSTPEGPTSPTPQGPAPTNTPRGSGELPKVSLQLFFYYFFGYSPHPS